MITMSITMYMRPEKEQELLVTLNELESLNRQASGYVGTAIHRDPEEKQVITLCEEWQSRRDLDRYMQSQAFEILLGAIKVLTASVEIEIISGNRISHHQAWGKKGTEISAGDLYRKGE